MDRAERFAFQTTKPGQPGPRGSSPKRCARAGLSYNLGGVRDGAEGEKAAGDV